MFNKDHVHEKKAKKKSMCLTAYKASWSSPSVQAVRRPRLQTVRRQRWERWRPRLGTAFALHCIALHLRFQRKERGRLRGGSRPFRIEHRFAVISFSRALDCHTHWLKNEVSAFAGDVQAVLHSCHWNSLVTQCVRRDLNQKTVSPSEVCTGV